jgi:hypothetical protein
MQVPHSRHSSTTFNHHLTYLDDNPKLTDLFRMYNSAKRATTCVGFSDSRGRRCQQAIRDCNTHIGEGLLANLSDEYEHLSIEELEGSLREIAEIYLCDWHGDQNLEIVKDWARKLTKVKRWQSVPISHVRWDPESSERRTRQSSSLPHRLSQVQPSAIDLEGIASSLQADIVQPIINFNFATPWSSSPSQRTRVSPSRHAHTRSLSTSNILLTPAPLPLLPSCREDNFTEQNRGGRTSARALCKETDHLQQRIKDLEKEKKARESVIIEQADIIRDLEAIILAMEERRKSRSSEIVTSDTFVRKKDGGPEGSRLFVNEKSLQNWRN